MGGGNVRDTTRNQLKQLMTSSVAVQCNWVGKGGKHAVGNSVLKEVVSGELQISSSKSWF